MSLNEFTEYCRLCQSNIGTIPINNDVELLKKITNITKLEITNCYNSNMPPNICSFCQQKVIGIQIFIDMVQKVDEHLQSLGILKNKEIVSNEGCTSEKNTEDVFFKCEECLLIFMEKVAFEDHIVTHLGMEKLETTKEYICNICSESCQNYSVYNTHRKLFCRGVSEIVKLQKIQKHGDKTTRTIKKLRKKHKAKAEIKENSDLIDNSEGDADDNDQPFDDAECISEISKIHQSYPCIDKNCTRVFSSQYSLKIHQLNHEGNPRPFLCVTCGKDFQTRNSLSCHEKIHSDIKAYRCDLCNIDFSVRSNLRAHIRKYHEGIRFQCSQCTKQFLTKCSLERHEKLHTGIKEFKCVHCKAEFYTNKELMKHQRYHQGFKQHKCQECFKSFYERHHLIVHLRSHTGERPYVCEIPGCGKSFVESQKLKRHHKAKHIAQ